LEEIIPFSSVVFEVISWTLSESLVLDEDTEPVAEDELLPREDEFSVSEDSGALEELLALDEISLLECSEVSVEPSLSEELLDCSVEPELSPDSEVEEDAAELLLEPLSSTELGLSEEEPEEYSVELEDCELDEDSDFSLEELEVCEALLEDVYFPLESETSEEDALEVSVDELLLSPCLLSVVESLEDEVSGTSFFLPLARSWLCVVLVLFCTPAVTFVVSSFRFSSPTRWKDFHRSSKLHLEVSRGIPAAFVSLERYLAVFLRPLLCM